MLRTRAKKTTIHHTGTVCSLAWLLNTEYVAAVDSIGQLQVYHQAGGRATLELLDKVYCVCMCVFMCVCVCACVCVCVCALIYVSFVCALYAGVSTVCGCG